MHTKVVYCGFVVYEHIQNKALHEARVIVLYMSNWVNANNYRLFFGYKCTINTKIFTCFSIIIWMIIINAMHNRTINILYTIQRGLFLHDNCIYFFILRLKVRTKKATVWLFWVETQTPPGSYCFSDSTYWHLLRKWQWADEEQADLTSETLAWHLLLYNRICGSIPQSKRD